MIGDACTRGERLGRSVGCCAQAGPFQTTPSPGQGGWPRGRPARQAHAYVRNGTAKGLTRFHPAAGAVRRQGVTGGPNAVLHGWLKEQRTVLLDALTPAAAPAHGATLRAAWERWQRGWTVKPTRAQPVPPLRRRLVLDNRAGHKTPDFVLWLFAHGVMPLDTPLGGRGLHGAESIQRILKRRALDGQHPAPTGPIIAWLEAVAEPWNRGPTPFAWGGKRKRRRDRQRERRHRVGGSAAFTRRPLRRRTRRSYGHAQPK